MPFRLGQPTVTVSAANAEGAPLIGRRTLDPFRCGNYYFALTDLPAERRSLQASMTRSAIEVSAFLR